MLLNIINYQKQFTKLIIIILTTTKQIQKKHWQKKEEQALKENMHPMNLLISKIEKLNLNVVPKIINFQKIIDYYIKQKLKHIIIKAIHIIFLMIIYKCQQ